MAKTPQSNTQNSAGAVAAPVVSSPQAPTSSMPNNPASSSGSLVVAHTRRTMKAYNFTDSDLDMISMTNWVSSACFAFAAFVGALWVDIKRDLIMVEELTPGAEWLNLTSNWVALPAVAVAVAIGGVALWKRRTVIERVKEDSVNT